MESKCILSPRCIFFGTVILGAAASLSHFAYPLSGENFIIGLFNPINESVWEHLKFMFFPFLLWWIAFYILKKPQCSPPYAVITAAAASLIAAPLTVILLFYAYTGALGIESVTIDASLVFICYFIALRLAAHLLRYSTPGKRTAIAAVVCVAVIFAAFIIFTHRPPQLPIFISK